MIEALKEKKVALIHDWLNGMRGGEKCLEVFCELFPQAEIYTLIYEPGKLSPTIEAMPIHTSFIQKMPLGVKRYRHFLPLFPKAIEQFDLEGYDLILSSSHCAAKGVIPYEDTYHISYIHAPMRYMWNLFDTYFNPETTQPAVLAVAKMARPYLQRWDKESTKRVDALLCNSKNIKRQIQEIYQREAQVIYPPVNLDCFKPAYEHKENYYLMVGAFAPNKRVDLAIEAFNKLRLPLKIVGSGQNEAYCRSIAGATISFLGSVEDRQIQRLYQQARAFVFPGEDDFGITPLEAQASGTPVIAFAKGGALETVTAETGLFFHEQSVEALCEAVESMEQRWAEYSPQQCVQQATRFNRDRFKKQVAHAVEFGYTQWQQLKTSL
ncbi:glycosyltransferase [Deltaproteobacteria bacterium TL4]